MLHDARAYRALYRLLADRTRETLGLAVDPLPVLVVGRGGPLDAGTERLSGPGGLHGLYVRDRSGRTAIHVLCPLPEARVQAVLAHELAHAWQAEHCPDFQGRRIREGFAEWVAWKVLEGLDGCEAERRVIAGRSDDYGAGFRLFAGLERRLGPERAIWYAQSARQSVTSGAARPQESGSRGP